MTVYLGNLGKPNSIHSSCFKEVASEYPSNTPVGSPRRSLPSILPGSVNAQTNDPTPTSSCTVQNQIDSDFKFAMQLQKEEFKVSTDQEALKMYYNKMLGYAKGLLEGQSIKMNALKGQFSNKLDALATKANSINNENVSEVLDELQLLYDFPSAGQKDYKKLHDIANKIRVFFEGDKAIDVGGPDDLEKAITLLHFLQEQPDQNSDLIEELNKKIDDYLNGLADDGSAENGTATLVIQSILNKCVSNKRVTRGESQRLRAAYKEKYKRECDAFKRLFDGDIMTSPYTSVTADKFFQSHYDPTGLALLSSDKEAHQQSILNLHYEDINGFNALVTQINGKDYVWVSARQVIGEHYHFLTYENKKDFYVDDRQFSIDIKSGLLNVLKISQECEHRFIKKEDFIKIKNPKEVFKRYSTRASKSNPQVEWENNNCWLAASLADAALLSQLKPVKPVSSVM